MEFEESNLEADAFLSAFTHGLAELGWTDGRNVRIDVRWAAGSVDRARMFAKELVDLQPDVIFVSTSLGTAAIQRQTRTIPIIFAFATGFDAGLPGPGANITGFIGPQASLAGKWLELLTEIAPGIKRHRRFRRSAPAETRGRRDGFARIVDDHGWDRSLIAQRQVFVLPQ